MDPNYVKRLSLEFEGSSQLTGMDLSTARST